MIELAGDAEIEWLLGVGRGVPGLGAASGGDDGRVEVLMRDSGVELCSGSEASDSLVVGELRAVEPVRGLFSPLIWIVGVAATD